MSEIIIVGSGASGVHFALSLLKKGLKVKIIDVGYERPENLNHEDSYEELKKNLKDPVSYFLGKEFESVVSPEFAKEIYGFSPGKKYIFKKPDGFNVNEEGFESLFSFAQGGLAEAWTGGSYSFNDADLEDFPFDYKDIEPYYNEIAERIGVIGTDDDLAQFFPYHKNLLSPLKFDEHSELLDKTYIKNKDKINKMGVFMGRSRIAVLSEDKGNRKACDYSGRCMWNCPTDSIYVPSITLNECKTYDNFTYVSGMKVSHFKYENKKVSDLVAENIYTGEQVSFKVDKLAIAAGTLSSSKIFLDSIYYKTGKIHKLTGLMDNRQILVPFINLKMIGKAYDPNTYQYHQLAMGIQTDKPKEYIHGQITSLKTALMQPALQSMPLDYKTAIFLGKNLHSALGVFNINFHDYRREENYISIKKDNNNTIMQLKYSPAKEEKARIKFAIGKVKKFLGKVGAFVPPGQSHTRPMGASVHYSGTIPMSKEKKQFTVSGNCKSNDFDNLYFVDGTPFPFLPAKNLTFSLMANAARVADKEF